jgi:hypothetical protein
MNSPTDMARLVAKQAPLAEMFIAFACCAPPEQSFLRWKESGVCSLKRGVIRRSGVAKAFSLRLGKGRQVGIGKGKSKLTDRYEPDCSKVNSERFFSLWCGSQLFCKRAGRDQELL